MVFRHGSCCGTRVATWVSTDCFRPRREVRYLNV
jgi:hypothetical protein